MKNIVLILLFSGLSICLYSQKKNSDVDLRSPFESINTHLYYLKNDSYNSEKSKIVFGKNVVDAEKLAIQLKQIFDAKGLVIEFSKIPTNPNYTDTLTGEAIYKLFPKELPTVYVKKYNNDWLYADVTIKDIPRLHKRIYPFGANILVNLFPEFGQTEFLELKIWQWFGSFILIILTLLIYKLITLIIRPVLKQILESRFQKIIPDSELVWKIARLLSVLIGFQLLKILFPILQLSVHLSQSIISGIEIVQTVFFIFLLLRIVDLVIHYFKRITDKTENTLDNQLVPIFRTTLNAIIIIGGIINILTLLNVNVTALIAGISIGGLALALAAQDTVKNLIGSVMIFVDKPFQIGDSIKVKDVTGTIEVVGFRSTRIRTPESSVVTIPNGILANEIVNNLGLRIYRKFILVIGVTYQTSPDLLEEFVDTIKEIIKRHPKTKKEGFEVVFNNMSTSSLDISMNGFLEVSSGGEESKVKQEILLAIIRAAELLNINFAYPSTSVYMEKMEVLPSKKTYKSVEEFLKNFEQQFEKKE